MNIDTVIRAFALAEDGLAITEPRPLRLACAYDYLPPSRDSLNIPCTLHQYRPITEQRGPNGLRTRRYAMRIQLFVVRLPTTDTDIWSHVAASFDDAIVSLYDRYISLGLETGVTYQRLFDFGGQLYQPAILEWNGASFLGTQYEYEVQIRDTVEFATGSA